MSDAINFGEEISFPHNTNRRRCVSTPSNYQSYFGTSDDNNHDDLQSILDEINWDPQPPAQQQQHPHNSSNESLLLGPTGMDFLTSGQHQQHQVEVQPPLSVQQQEQAELSFNELPQPQEHQSSFDGTEQQQQQQQQQQPPTERMMGLVNRVTNLTHVTPSSIAVNNTSLILTMSRILESVKSCLSEIVDNKKHDPVISKEDFSLNANEKSSSKSNSNNHHSEQTINPYHIYDAKPMLYRLDSYKGIIGHFLEQVSNDSDAVALKKVLSLVNENEEVENEDGEDKDDDEDEDDEDHQTPVSPPLPNKRKRDDDDEEGGSERKSRSSRGDGKSSSRGCKEAATSSKCSTSGSGSCFGSTRNSATTTLTRCNCKSHQQQEESSSSTTSSCVGQAINLAASYLKREDVNVSNPLISIGDSDKRTLYVYAFFRIFQELILMLCSTSQVLLNGYDFGKMLKCNSSDTVEFPKLKMLDQEDLCRELAKIKTNVENLSICKMMDTIGCVISNVVD